MDMKKILISICFLLSMFALQKIDISATEEQNENETYKVYQNEFVEVDGKLYFYDDNGNMVHWQQTIEGKEYYFTGNGYAYKGMLYYEDGSIKYYKDDYSMAKNEFVNHNNELYYMGLDGLAQYGDKIINGKSYYFTADGSAYKGILQKNDGTVRVYKENGSMAVNEFVTIEDKLYYMGSDGAPLMWQQTIEGKEYYFTGNGYAYKGMLYYEDGSLRYYLSDGSMAKNTFVETNGKLYYMGSDGAPLMWQQTIEGKEYYFTGNGYAYKGMLYYEDGSLRYYLSDGSMAKNTFVETNGKLYYMGSDGAPLMWQQTIEGKQYYFTGNGYAYKGMLYYEDGSLRYYLTDGSMAKESFVETNGKLYYMGSDGVPLMWQQTIEEKEYYFTGNGYAYKGILYFEDGTAKYFYQNGVKATHGWITENKNKYYIDNNDNVYFGWLDEKSDRYYFSYNNGKMVTGSQTIDRRNYYFNPSNGKLMRMSAPVPYYMQTDPRWKDKKYGGNTMKSSGCAQTCAAMIFSFLRNETILPTDVANWGYKNNYFNGIMDGERFGGTIGSFWPAVAKHYGFTARGNLTVDQAINDLKHGKLMIAGMNPPNFTFYGSTHAIVIYGIDENNYVSVYDPYFKEHNKKYPISQIFKEKSTDPDDRMSGGPIFTIG